MDALLRADILTRQSRKDTVVYGNINNSQSLHLVTTQDKSVSEHAQNLSTGAGSPKWNAAIITVINATCAFPALIHPNVRCEKGMM